MFFWELPDSLTDRAADMLFDELWEDEYGEDERKWLLNDAREYFLDKTGLGEFANVARFEIVKDGYEFRLKVRRGTTKDEYRVNEFVNRAVGFLESHGVIDEYTGDMDALFADLERFFHDRYLDDDEAIRLLGRERFNLFLYSGEPEFREIIGRYDFVVARDADGEATAIIAMTSHD